MEVRVMKGIFLKRGKSFIPAGEEADELLGSIKDGKECIIDIRIPRSTKQLRMFWALCQIVAENDPKCPTKDFAKRNILWSLNYITIWIDRGEKVHVEPAPINFESMTQEDFNPFFQRAIDLICVWLNTAPDEVRKRVAEIVDPAPGHQWRD
jgi:hypothetical protein